MATGRSLFPVTPEDQAKTAFCSGPGMGLHEFCCMPYGLRGAPGSFQRLMDKIFHGLSFVVIYLDDILIYSEDVTQHTDNLHQVFGRLQSAGLHSKGANATLVCPQSHICTISFQQRGWLQTLRKPR